MAYMSYPSLKLFGTSQNNVNQEKLLLFHLNQGKTSSFTDENQGKMGVFETKSGEKFQALH